MRFSIIIFLFILLQSCQKEDFINARISGSYDCFIKKQNDVWFQSLALNYTENDELNAFTVWEGEGEPKLIRMNIEKRNRRKIEFIIPEQTYEDGKMISGDGILIDNTIEFYYIIGNLNLTRTYTLSGNK